MKAQRITLFPSIFGILLIFTLFFGAFQAVATERERITPENIDRLTEIASIGRGTVRNLVWTPDSQGFVITDDSGLYYYATGDLSKSPTIIEHPSSRLFNVKISPDSQFLAATTIQYSDSGISHDHVWIWNLATAELVSSTTTLNHTWADVGSITDYFFVPSSMNIYILTNNGRMLNWNFSSSSDIETIEVEIPPNFAFRLLSPNGRWLVEFTGRQLSVWDTESWLLTISEDITDYRESPFRPENAIISPDSTKLLTIHNTTAYRRYDLMLWSLDDGRLIASNTLDENQAAQFGSDGTPLVITHNCDKPETDDFHLILSDLISGDVLWDSATQSVTHPNFTLVLPTYACQRSNGSPGTDIVLWNITTGESLGYYSLMFYSYFAFSPDQSKLLTGSAIEGDIQGWRAEDTHLSVIDLATGEILSDSVDFIHHIFTPAFSPDSRFLFMGDKERIRRWDMATGEISHEFRVGWEDFHNPRLVYTDFAFDTPSTMLRAEVSSSNGSEATAIWNWQTGDFISIAGDWHNATFDHQYAHIAEVTANDGQNSTITILDASTRNVAKTFTVEGQVRMLTYSPDNRYLALITYRGGIHVRDMLNDTWIFEAQSEIEENTYWYRHSRFFHNNQWLITTTSSGYTEVWNLETQTRWGEVLAIDFSPDDSQFAAIRTEDHILHFYDMNTGERIQNSYSVENAAGVAYSPDGDLLAIQSYAEPTSWAWLPPSEIWLYDVTTGERLATLDTHSALFNPFFSPDGTMLAVQSDSRRLIVYGID